MKSNTLFTKLVAMLVCLLMVVGCLPVAAFATNDWEGEIDTADPIPGSEEAPIRLTSLENTVTVAAGETMYYYGNFNGMVMTVSGSDFVVLVGEDTFTPDENGLLTMEVVTASPRAPFTFAIVNNGAEDNEYYVNFAYPEGSMDNPKDLIEGENTVSLEAGNMGYYYDFVAHANGYVTFQISSEEGWTWCINNTTAGTYGDTYTSNDEDVYVWEQTFKYTSGDEYVLMVNTYNPEDRWNAPAGDITVNVIFVVGWGTEDSPIKLNALDNNVSIPAGETRYYEGYFSGMNMVVSGNEGFVVNYNGAEYADSYGSIAPIAVDSGSPRMPVQFSITNNSAEEAGYYIGFTYPKGTMNNPQDLGDGDNEHAFEAGDGAWYYDYVGYTNGTLTITVSADCEMQYVINNLTAGTYGDTQWSDDDSFVNSQTFEYMAGDEYVIEIATYNPEDMWATPAGTVNVNVEFVPGFGTEADPFQLYSQENVVNIADGDPVYYTGRFAGMTMTVTGNGDFSVIMNGETYNAVNGVVTIENLPGNNWMPPVFAIDGNGEFAVNFSFPAGHSENPAVAVLGNNAATVAEGTQGYYWTYTAEKAGDLLITVNAQPGWTYTINNMTTYAYGDMQWSDSDPVVNPAVITVAAGDEIMIIANTYDAENPWTAPAGDISVNIAYDAPEAPAVAIKFASANMTLEADLTINFYVKPEVMNQYTDKRVEFVVAGNTLVVTEPVYDSAKNLYNYRCTGIAPKMIKENVCATLYGTFDGVEYTKVQNYSAYTYLKNQLKSSNAKLRTLAVDLMNYGTLHQQYTSYNLDNLINADLTAEQKGYGTASDPALENYTNTKHIVRENVEASFKGAKLVLENAVIMQAVIQCNDMTDVSVEFVVDGVAYMVDGSECEKAIGYTDRYNVYFTGLKATQFREVVEVTVYRGDTAISNTLAYSVESYAYSQKDNTTREYLADLVKSIVNYGDSARAYILGE